MTGEARSSASERDAHLFGPGPKRILSLDGGGVRGAFTLAFLERLEALESERAGRPRKLCEVFDLIGGTSTGAIIAAGLALGLDVRSLRDFYFDLAPRIFRRPFWRVVGLQAKFDARRLQVELDTIIGNRLLGSGDLQTGLCVVMKRLDTGSAWLVANNPRSPFWDGPDPASANSRLRLASLVRASTAAPHFFDPELIPLFEGGEAGLFVDGGVTPFNNPSLALFLMAALPQYRLGWALGPEALTIVSVGTGRFRSRMAPGMARRIGAIGLAINALKGLIADGQTFTLGMMQALGQSEAAWTINSEVGDMAGLPLPGGPLFALFRYDVELEGAWLEAHLGRRLDPATLAGLQLMDDPKRLRLAYEIGQQAAALQVKPHHLS